MRYWVLTWKAKQFHWTETCPTMHCCVGSTWQLVNQFVASLAWQDFLALCCLTFSPLKRFIWHAANTGATVKAVVVVCWGVGWGVNNILLLIGYIWEGHSSTKVWTLTYSSFVWQILVFMASLKMFSVVVIITQLHPVSKTESLPRQRIPGFISDRFMLRVPGRTLYFKTLSWLYFRILGLFFSF